MNKSLLELADGPLFEGIAPEDRTKLLACLDPQVREYPRGGFVMLAGEPVRHVGLLLRGSLQVLMEDFSGNRNLLSRVVPGELFAEVMACLEIPRAPVTVAAEPGTAVALFDFKRILHVCAGVCDFHNRLVSNMMVIIAEKNLQMQMKVNCIGHRTTREKVETYLALQHEQAGTNPFRIPLNRAQMAQYLCVDRSALSAVLARMQEEGLIRFERDEFEILSEINNN